MNLSVITRRESIPQLLGHFAHGQRNRLRHWHISGTVAVLGIAVERHGADELGRRRPAGPVRSQSPASRSGLGRKCGVRRRAGSPGPLALVAVHRSKLFDTVAAARPGPLGLVVVPRPSQPFDMVAAARPGPLGLVVVPRPSQPFDMVAAARPGPLGLVVVPRPSQPFDMVAARRLVQVAVLRKCRMRRVAVQAAAAWWKVRR